ncbi:MAG: ATP-binding protein [Spirochaetaceae bacterium]
MSEKRAVLLTGLRRVGKTSLMKRLLAQLIQEGTSAQDVLYVSLDDYLLRDNSILDIVSAFRKIHKHSVDRTVYLFLDEIAFKADFQQQLKNLVDNRNAVIVASSSSATILADQRGLMTGRAATVEVQPLSLEEYLRFRGMTVKRRDRQLLESYFRDYMRDGGMPENVLQPSREYLMSLVDDIIQKDITAFHGIRDPRVAQDFFTLLMERSGKQVSINKVARILDIAPDTARRYLGYFRDAYLVHLVPRWGKTNERVLSPKKLYACDLGIQHLFIGDRDLGSYFENYVYHLLRPRGALHYVYEDGVEIDFRTHDGLLIECKFNGDLSKGQREYLKGQPEDKTIVVDSVAALEQLPTD